jgi:hypothetical protein
MRQKLLVQNWGSINATTLATPMPFRLVRLNVAFLNGSSGGYDVDRIPPAPLASAGAAAATRRKETRLLSAGRPARASARGNLGPPSVVTENSVVDWLKDRWQAARDMYGTPLKGPQWVAIELAQRCVPERVILDWETSYADDYEFQVRIAIGTGDTWAPVKTKRSSRDKSQKQHIVDVLSVDDAAQAQLRATSAAEPQLTHEFRVYIQRPATQWGVSLWRFELWGDCTEP